MANKAAYPSLWLKLLMLCTCNAGSLEAMYILMFIWVAYKQRILDCSHGTGKSNEYVYNLKFACALCTCQCQKPPFQIPRSATAHYWYTWDVGCVLVSYQVPANKLPPFPRSLNLVLLLAIPQVSRSLELAALDLWFRIRKAEGVLFIIQQLTKKRSPGTSPREASGGYPMFSDQYLCVVRCLKE